MKWSNDENEYLKTHYKLLTSIEISEQMYILFDRDIQAGAVRKQARILGLSKSRKKVWFYQI